MWGGDKVGGVGIKPTGGEDEGEHSVLFNGLIHKKGGQS